MSVPEHTDQAGEQRSRVKVVMNAKHEPQWEISVVEGAQVDEIVRLREIAVQQHRALVEELIGVKALQADQIRRSIA